MEAYEEHCKRVFPLPAMEPQEVLSHPDPKDLALDAASIWATLTFNYKGNKASGPSKLPTLLIKHLHMRNDGVILTMFKAVLSRS